MFFTSVVATFLAALSFNSVASNGTLSTSDVGLATATFVVPINTIMEQGQNNPSARIYYTGTDEDGNEIKSTVFYVKYVPSSYGLVYGYNGVASNVNFNAKFDVGTAGNLTTFYSEFVPQCYGTDDDYFIDISSVNVTSSTILACKVTFTLMSDRDYSFVADGGYHDGYVNGFNDGVAQGSQEGRENGYYDGFQDAKDLYENQDATVTSIFQGILSIGLIPVEFFMSIFNFSILGVNITSIITAILTLMVLVILMRIILGGKGKD